MTSLDHIIFTICAWWRNRCLSNADPEIAGFRQEIRRAVRAKKPVKAIRKKYQDAMTRALREGV